MKDYKFTVHFTRDYMEVFAGSPTSAAILASAAKIKDGKDFLIIRITCAELKIDETYMNGASLILDEH